MSQRSTVVVTDYITEPGPEAKVLAPAADLVFADARSDGDLVTRYPEAEALLVFHDITITEVALAGLKNLRGVVRVGVGFDNVDTETAGKHGIVVCNVPDYGTEDVADHALMMMLAVCRHLKTLDDSIRGGGWDATLIYGAPRMRGTVLGIIGCGRIGSAMALRGKALGMRVVMYDPYQPAGYEKALGIERAYRFEDFLAIAEVVSIHTPLTEETRHILNAETLAQLPKGAYVINTARGPCIDNNALYAALESGQIGGAGLDVVEREPLDDDRLRQHPRVLLTPHAAFYSVAGFTEMRLKAGEEVLRMLTGEPVRNVVNRSWLSEPRCQLPPAQDPL